VKYFLAILLLANLLTYGVYWLDKRRARKGARRIPERELLLWAAAGGSLGAILAMRHFRHKTRSAFRWAVYGVAVLQGALLLFLL